MSNVLGVIGFVIFITAVVAAAAGVTWVVVRVSPAKKPDEAPKA